MANIIPDVLAVSNIVSLKDLQFSRGKAIKNAPIAPTAADSVGVAKPVYMLPITRMIKTTIPQTPFKDLKR